MKNRNAINLGKLGGRSKSPAKVAASIANAKLATAARIAKSFARKQSKSK